MKINYTFNNGENSEVEVNEEIGAVILESRRKEENMERNRRRRCYSLDDVDFEGDDFADERTPESLFMEQLDNEHIKETLDKLSETQRRRLLMYAEGMSIEDIRVYLNGDTLAVQSHQLNNGTIDKLTIFAGKNTIRYRVRTIGSKDYLSWMENKKETSGGSDTFAGDPGKAIDRVQIVVKS